MERAHPSLCLYVREKQDYALALSLSLSRSSIFNEGAKLYCSVCPVCVTTAQRVLIGPTHITCL